MNILLTNWLRYVMYTLIYYTECVSLTNYDRSGLGFEFKEAVFNPKL